MAYKFTASLFILSLLVSSEALRILLCFPMTSKSHSILGHGYANRLLEAGHEVVHLTSYPSRKVVQNLTEIDVSYLQDLFKEATEKDDVFKLKNIIGKKNVEESLIFFYFVFTVHKNILTDPNVVKLLSDPKQKFDAVILEWFFTEITAGIPALFECPLIWACSTEPHWQALRLIDEIPNPAYTLDLFSHNRIPLTFWQRVEELWKVVKRNVQLAIYYPFEKWAYNSIYSEIAAKRGVTLPSYDEAIYNGSFMFLNAHPSIGGSMKLPQNVVNIAGYHIEKTKPLPKDLQKLMDEAKHGVIYFSMGSIVKSDGMSEEMKRSLLDMFSKYKQTVIWKFESDLTDVPPNVHLVKWTPQPSILAHPNLKLFITHGGQLSTSEAIHYGVPLVGLPVMADQHYNMRSVETKGFGIKVTLAEDMGPELDAAVRKILTDQLYTNRAKELSTLFHDRDMTPGAALPYWVEFVVRNRGAPHLRSPAIAVPLYQKLYLDLAVVLAIFIGCIWKFVKYVLSRRSNKKSKKKSS